MPRRRPWPAALPDVFRGSDAVAEGLLTPSQLRDRRRVAPVLHGVYRPASVALTHPLVCRAAALVVPASAQLTGPSMATVLGVPLAGAHDPVTMVISGDAPPRIDRVDVRHASTHRPPSGTWCGVPLADRRRMGFDLAARQPLERAVARLDAVARAGLIDHRTFTAWADAQHDDDVVLVRAASRLADPRAESPPESVCRVRLRAAGLAVVPQLEVHDARGWFVARLDLGLEEERVGIEYDGAWHGDGAQVAKDRARLNRLREAGWVVVHVTAATLRRPGELEAMVLAEVGRRRTGLAPPPGSPFAPGDGRPLRTS